jgi:hypothetical protein
VKLEPSVKARLARLDPRYDVVWHRFLIDPLTERVIETQTGSPVEDPMFWVFRNCPDGKRAFVTVFDKFGHEEVFSMETDAARIFGPDKAQKFSERMIAKYKAQMQADFKQLQTDKIAANKSRIGDLIFEGKRGERQAKPFSAPGLGKRGTPGTIQMDPQEDGWELPS